MNGKLTHAPHSKQAAHINMLLGQVFTDVHGPVPIQSCCGNQYWVTLSTTICNFWLFYFIERKSNIFAAFKHYKAWAENITQGHIHIVHDDKGGKFTSA
jgi:hypothetical protein